jgi:hypothetical protein
MTFAISRGSNHIVVQVSGIATEAEKRQMLADMAMESRSAGVKRALVECGSAIDPVAVLALVNELRALGFPTDYKFALVALNAEGRATSEFAETAAANRGWRMRAFTDNAAALAWLNEN